MLDPLKETAEIWLSRNHTKPMHDCNQLARGVAHQPLRPVQGDQQNKLMNLEQGT